MECVIFNCTSQLVEFKYFHCRYFYYLLSQVVVQCILELRYYISFNRGYRTGIVRSPSFHFTHQRMYH